MWWYAFVSFYLLFGPLIIGMMCMMVAKRKFLSLAGSQSPSPSILQPSKAVHTWPCIKDPAALDRFNRALMYLKSITPPPTIDEGPSTITPDELKNANPLSVVKKILGIDNEETLMQMFDLFKQQTPSSPRSKRFRINDEAALTSTMVNNWLSKLVGLLTKAVDNLKELHHNDSLFRRILINFDIVSRFDIMSVAVSVDTLNTISGLQSILIEYNQFASNALSCNLIKKVEELLSIGRAETPEKPTFALVIGTTSLNDFSLYSKDAGSKDMKDSLPSQSIIGLCTSIYLIRVAFNRSKSQQFKLWYNQFRDGFKDLVNGITTYYRSYEPLHHWWEDPDTVTPLVVVAPVLLIDSQARTTFHWENIVNYLDIYIQFLKSFRLVPTVQSILDHLIEALTVYYNLEFIATKQLMEDILTRPPSLPSLPSSPSTIPLPTPSPSSSLSSSSTPVGRSGVVPTAEVDFADVKAGWESNSQLDEGGDDIDDESHKDKPDHHDDSNGDDGDDDDKEEVIEVKKVKKVKKVAPPRRRGGRKKGQLTMVRKKKVTVKAQGKSKAKAKAKSKAKVKAIPKKKGGKKQVVQSESEETETDDAQSEVEDASESEVEVKEIEKKDNKEEKDEVEEDEDDEEVGEQKKEEESQNYDVESEAIEGEDVEDNLKIEAINPNVYNANLGRINQDLNEASTSLNDLSALSNLFRSTEGFSVGDYKYYIGLITPLSSTRQLLDILDDMKEGAHLYTETGLTTNILNDTLFTDFLRNIQLQWAGKDGVYQTIKDWIEKKKIKRNFFQMYMHSIYQPVVTIWKRLEDSKEVRSSSPPPRAQPVDNSSSNNSGSSNNSSSSSDIPQRCTTPLPTDKPPAVLPQTPPRTLVPLYSLKAPFTPPSSSRIDCPGHLIQSPGFNELGSSSPINTRFTPYSDPNFGVWNNNLLPIISETTHNDSNTVTTLTMSQYTISSSSSSTTPPRIVRINNITPTPTHNIPPTPTHILSPRVSKTKPKSTTIGANSQDPGF